MIDRLIVAAEHADWMQVVLNQGPPCFQVEQNGHFCLCAERWAGHGNGPTDIHPFVSLADLLAALRQRHAEAEADIQAAQTVNDVLKHNNERLLAELRGHRHAEAVKACWREAFFAGVRAEQSDGGGTMPDDSEAAWLASEAKARLA